MPISKIKANYRNPNKYKNHLKFDKTPQTVCAKTAIKKEEVEAKAAEKEE